MRRSPDTRNEAPRRRMPRRARAAAEDTRRRRDSSRTPTCASSCRRRTSKRSRSSARPRRTLRPAVPSKDTRPRRRPHGPRLRRHRTSRTARRRRSIRHSPNPRGSRPERRRARHTPFSVPSKATNASGAPGEALRELSRRSTLFPSAHLGRLRQFGPAHSTSRSWSARRPAHAWARALPGANLARAVAERPRSTISAGLPAPARRPGCTPRDRKTRTRALFLRA